MPEPPWPESRVRAAYAEWQALTDHARTVSNEMDKARGVPPSHPFELSLPDWIGTGWPGQKAVFDAGLDAEISFPLAWLWNYPECVAVVQREQEIWELTREAEEQERAERETLARLKAKYEKVDA